MRTSRSGATVVDVSSEFSAGFAAELAVDGDLATEWSTSGDGDDGSITIDLGAARDIAGIEFVTRSMADGTAITSTFTVRVDDGDPLGPFPAAGVAERPCRTSGCQRPGRPPRRGPVVRRQRRRGRLPRFCPGLTHHARRGRSVARFDRPAGCSAAGLMMLSPGYCPGGVGLGRRAVCTMLSRLGVAACGPGTEGLA